MDVGCDTVVSSWFKTADGKKYMIEFERAWCICTMGPMGCMDSGGYRDDRPASVDHIGRIGIELRSPSVVQGYPGLLYQDNTDS